MQILSQLTSAAAPVEPLEAAPPPHPTPAEPDRMQSSASTAPTWCKVHNPKQLMPAAAASKSQSRGAALCALPPPQLRPTKCRAARALRQRDERCKVHDVQSPTAHVRSRAVEALGAVLCADHLGAHVSRRPQRSVHVATALRPPGSRKAWQDAKGASGAGGEGN